MMYFTDYLRINFSVSIRVANYMETVHVLNHNLEKQTYSMAVD